MPERKAVGWDPRCGCSVKWCVSGRCSQPFKTSCLLPRMPWLEEQGWLLTGSAEVMMLWRANEIDQAYKELSASKRSNCQLAIVIDYCMSSLTGGYFHPLWIRILAQQSYFGQVNFMSQASFPSSIQREKTNFIALWNQDMGNASCKCWASCSIVACQDGISNDVGWRGAIWKSRGPVERGSWRALWTRSSMETHLSSNYLSVSCTEEEKSLYAQGCSSAFSWRSVLHSLDIPDERSTFETQVPQAQNYPTLLICLITFL